jgi:hypothetical protein
MCLLLRVDGFLKYKFKAFWQGNLLEGIHLKFKEMTGQNYDGFYANRL